MATIQKRERKRGTTYTATIRIAGYAPLTRTFDRKAEAVFWIAETESEMRSGRWAGPEQAGKIKLYEAFKRYREEVTTKKKLTTQQREIGAINHVAFAIGTEMPITHVTREIVAKYRDKRLKQATAYTVRLEMALLSHLYKIMKNEWGVVCENPVEGVARPAPPRGRTRFLTKDEAERLLDACGKRRNKMLRPYVITMLHTGMRPSECAGLKWGQIDLQKRILTLRDTKTGDDRVVPMTTALVAELSKLQDGQGPDEYVFVSDKQASSYRDHTVISQAFRMSWETARKEAGVPDVRLHDLRHTAASWLIMAGVDLRTIADILGHSGLHMAMKYTHLLDQHKIDAVEKIGGLGFGK